MPLRAGDRLDRYELVVPIAAGGMGHVWLARLQAVHGFEKLVAIKTIIPEHAQGERFRRMLIDEARLASRIQHENVALTLDVGESDGWLFMVMEWVDGFPLSRLQRTAHASGHRVPLPIVLRVMADAAAGLHAAHALADEHGRNLGVVHRDVSPQNILVSMTGHAKLIDFGVAKGRHKLESRASNPRIRGKPYYMAPEQAHVGPIDCRADVWALGATLYHLLTGSPPFAGATPVATLLKLMGDEPIRPLPDSIPAGVRKIVDRSLVREPGKRLASALEFGVELETALREMKLSATTRDVAAYVRDTMRPAALKRRQRIRAALRARELSTGVRTRPPRPSVAPNVAPDAVTSVAHAPDTNDPANLRPVLSRSQTMRKVAPDAPSAEVPGSADVTSEPPGDVRSEPRFGDAATSCTTGSAPAESVSADDGQRARAPVPSTLGERAAMPAAPPAVDAPLEAPARSRPKWRTEPLVSMDLESVPSMPPSAPPPLPKRAPENDTARATPLPRPPADTVVELRPFGFRPERPLQSATDQRRHLQALDLKPRSSDGSIDWAPPRRRWPIVLIAFVLATVAFFGVGSWLRHAGGWRQALRLDAPPSHKSRVDTPQATPDRGPHTPSPVSHTSEAARSEPRAAESDRPTERNGETGAASRPAEDGTRAATATHGPTHAHPSPPTTPTNVQRRAPRRHATTHQTGKPAGRSRTLNIDDGF